MLRFGDFMHNRGTELTSKEKELLQNTTISQNQPGAILRDFEAALEYVVEKRPSLTKGLQLSLKHLEPLNERLQKPIQHRLKRPQQKSIPPVNGLFLILRASGLTAVDGRGKNPRLGVREDVYASWRALNPTEKYFTLLESWLLRGDSEILGERGGWYSTAIFRCLEFFSRFPAEGINLEEDSNAFDRLRYWPELHNLALMELFGFVEVDHGEPVEGEGWQLNSVHITTRGQAILKIIAQALDPNDQVLFVLENPSQILPGTLQRYFQPFFPVWQQNLQWPEHAFRDGTYIFKVDLFKDVWWRIAISASSTLEDLSLAILRAANFDNDHLHQFIIPTTLGLQERVFHSYMDEGPSTDEVRIGDVSLPVSATMSYNFDFGDDWYFDVTLEEIQPPDKKLRRPKLLESHGKAPPQYGSYGDDDW